VQGAAARLRVDLGEVRSFAYYTGIRFAGYVPGVGDAVLHGGRYDDLVERYGRAVRATGFAVDVEAIAQGEQAQGRGDGLPRRGVLIAGEGERPYALAAALRRLAARAAGPGRPPRRRARGAPRRHGRARPAPPRGPPRQALRGRPAAPGRRRAPQGRRRARQGARSSGTAKERDFGWPS